MTYYVNKTDGTAIVVLDGTKDTTSTSLTLLGKLSSNYGENQNENFVRLLENFAFNTSPANPITGQIWYDTGNLLLKVYNSSTSSWSSVGQNISGNTNITGNVVIGNLGFEIQEVLGQVKLINKTSNGNIDIVTNTGGTFTNVLTINATTGLITVAGNATNNSGITTKSYVDSLVNDAKIVAANATAAATASAEANAATQATSISSLQANIVALQSNITSLSTNISSGTSSVSAKDISLNGNIVLNNTGTGNTVVNFKTPGGVSILSASGSSNSATPVTILGQWALGSGASINALYADLAEYFSSDENYEPGTVVVFGGTAEVTKSTVENDVKLAGVVSTDPAYTMNNKLEGTKCCIGLQGRVPCKVIGPISKGDMLTTSSIPGHAKRAESPVLGAIIGKSLEDYNSTEAGIIEIVVGRL